jgi:hypothetical protein
VKRLNDTPFGELIFQVRGGPMNVSNECINHGLQLPGGKTLLETGLFVLGHLISNKGNNIEVAYRKRGSFAVHLVAYDAAKVVNPIPIRVYPNFESTDEISEPIDLFIPYYNCHGCTFGDRHYWINPEASSIDKNGKMVPIQYRPV